MKGKWYNILDRLYDEANLKIKAVTGRTLEKANFDFFSSSTKYGYWDKSLNKIGLNVVLFNYYEENAIKFVLFHEICHQVVSEIYNYHGSEHHGHHFKVACDMLGIDNRACGSSDFLKEYKKGEKNPLITKLEKLLDVSGRSEEEAQLFLNKANELMIKYNLSLEDVLGTDRMFLKRQVGESYERFPTYLFWLGNMINSYYGVRYIKSFSKVHKMHLGKSYSKENVNSVKNYDYLYHIELYGEADKLDLAEYVYETILNKAEELYEDYKNDPNRVKGYRKLSKKAFFVGLFEGFESKLKLSQKKVVDDLEESSGELIRLDDPILDEYYNKAYSRARSGHVSGSSASGYEAGYKEGSNLSIRNGVKSSSSDRQLIGS